MIDAGVRDRPMLRRALGLVRAAAEAGIPVRLLGGAAVGVLLGDRWPQPCRRDPGDVDLAARGRDRRALVALLERHGLTGEREFNLLHGRRQLRFRDGDGMRVDVILDVLRMCHAIPLDAGFAADGPALPPWLLLVTKLQVVELADKDRLDVAALLAGCTTEQLEPERVAAACADDWGLWRSVTGTLREVRGHVPVDGEERARVEAVAGDLLAHLEAEPKTLRWKVRAAVGERVRWYELPEGPDDP